MANEERFYTPEGHSMLNSVCDEFRSLLEAKLVESTEESMPLTSDSVLDAAHIIQTSPWLDRFREPGAEESISRVA